MANGTPEFDEAVIKVIGVGGGGCNAVNRMAEDGIAGVELLAANTDPQTLSRCQASRVILLGNRKLGAGGNPEVGREAAEESRQEIKKALEGADMVFITAGMGGGTGTGAAPIIAEICREIKALTVAIVTKPFAWEGAKRLRIAEEGVRSLKERVDTLITVPNDRLLSVAQGATLYDAFKIADSVLHHGVKGVAEIITVPGEINTDFQDVRAIMENAGSALMGIGVASGEGRAAAAAQAAISNPLVETSIDGARGVLLNIVSGRDFKLEELHQAAQTVRQNTDDENLNLILGHAYDDNMKDEVRITVIATGFEPPRIVRESEKAVSEREIYRQPGSEPMRTSRGDPHDWDIPTFLRER
ncbi:MAG: cell division protein FtsZ [Armatimonadota bacterium]